ncbi:putative expressed protein [Lyophyllum shimeji]|uniref:Expressed protein n=1 Tax=Lyophyllum shimeji TaxID=47721 RepID=A0A9P3PPH0_LYOSH|nr:putative expressed protein [Lyophyllum shimeji]
MMLLRINALYYYQQRLIVAGVALLLVCQTVMNAGLLTQGEAVVHNPYSGVRACTLIFDPSLRQQLHQPGCPCFTTPSFQGLRYELTYYTAIFAVTLVLTTMTVVAPLGLKNMTAQLELLLTASELCLSPHGF